MRRSWTVAIGLATILAACHRQPKPVLEYGETVTYTSTAADPAPAPAASSAPPAAADPAPA